MGFGWNFSSLFGGVDKQNYIKIMPRVQLTYTDDFLR